MSYLPDSIVERVHVESVEILMETGFCVPELATLVRLRAADRELA